MNVMRCTVGQDGRLTLDDGQSFAINERLEAGTQVDFGIRPEHVQVSQDPSMPLAKVLLVEPTGVDTLVTCRLGEDEILLVSSDRLTFAPGETIRLQFVADRHHLFDPTTGNRRAD